MHPRFILKSVHPTIEPVLSITWPASMRSASVSAIIRQVVAVKTQLFLQKADSNEAMNKHNIKNECKLNMV